MTSPELSRTLDEVRATILPMPFATSMQLEIERAGEGTGVVSLPLSDAVSYNDAAFAAVAVGVVADVAAGAAALATIPATAMVLTRAITTEVTGSTAGSRLSARAELRERDDRTLVFDATVVVAPAARPDVDAESRVCGSAVVTLAIVTPPVVTPPAS